MKTAFVTGATGFVGLNVVAALAAAGWRIVAMHRATSRLEDLVRFPVERVLGDVTDADAVMRAMPRGVDAVFHVAGFTALWPGAHDEQTRINVDGTRNVALAALERGAGRLVHTSSIAAFGRQSARVTEDTPSTAESSPVHFDRTKWEAEQEVREAVARGLDAVILEPANVVGAYDRKHFSQLFRLVREGRLPGVFPGRASWCHAREVGRAHVAAAERGRRGENYLLGGADASFREVLGVVGQLVGRTVPARMLPTWFLRAAARANQLAVNLLGQEPHITPEGVEVVAGDLVCDSAKAERELGYRPTPLREMFEDCYRWLRSEGLVG